MDNQNQKRNRGLEMGRTRGLASRLMLYTWRLALVVALGFTVSARAQSTGLYREIYLGIPGSTLLSFTNVFPPAPDLTTVETNLFETPSNYENNFGQRYRGLLVPPVTGEYVFWVQGQSSAILYLSPDESPANKIGIGYNLSSALARSWYVFPTQQSTNIYLEALHKAGNGDDSFAVGWKLPDGTYQQPMPAAHFRPYGQAAVSAPVLTTSPTNLAILEQLSATFRVTVSNRDPVTYRWMRDGTNVPGALGASYTLPAVTTSSATTLAP
jgi:hypothetical protein